MTAARPRFLIWGTVTVAVTIGVLAWWPSWREPSPASRLPGPRDPAGRHGPTGAVSSESSIGGAADGDQSPTDSRLSETAPSPNSQPAWPGFAFEQKSADAIRADFAHLPEYRGSWPAAFGPPESLGWTNFDSYDPATIPTIIDRYLEWYYDKFVGPQRENPEVADPDASVWPQFKMWFRDAILLYNDIMRRNMGAAESARHARRLGMDPAQVAEMEEEARRALEFTQRLSRAINKYEAKFIRKKT